MPRVQASPPDDKPRVVAIATSDWHIDDAVPAYRQNEPCWWKAQQRPIDQIKALQAKHKCPILFAGDLFNKAKPSPEVLNWALRHVPTMYAIPGNHDLPNHRYDDIHKCGYQVMVEAGRLIDIKPGHPHPVSNDLLVYGFPWGIKVTPPVSIPLTGVNVALIHAYCWKQGHSFPGAPEENRVSEWAKRTGGYAFAVFGDNHNPHHTDKEDSWVVNCGTTVRRRSDEAGYKPGVYLLWSDGDVSRKNLDVSEDVYAASPDKEVREAKDEIDADALIETISKLKQKTNIDFLATVDEIMLSLRVSDGVREKVLEAVEGA